MLIFQGPTECSINSTWNGNLKNSSEATNIGRSIGSCSWIVDSDNHDRLVPIGSAGELLIEGPILARGYLNDPEKTGKSFITNPRWATGEHRRLYKTGDLARNNSDGTITYLGRKDSQVKLNGQRIELGEIEHHLKANLPRGAQSAVELIVWKSKTKNSTKALAAFFSMQENGSIPTTNSNDFLEPMSEAAKVASTNLEIRIRDSLPAYMVPSIYIPVKALPTTSSGKLDRKRLRASCNSLSEDEMSMYRLATKSQRPPSSNMEIALAELWESILDLENNTVGQDDNFFRLGGDSVAAIRLISAARSRGIPLTVANIFKNPILLDLARDSALLSSVENSHTNEVVFEPFSLLPNDLPVKSVVDEVASLCGIHPDTIQDMYPCTPIQQGLIALSNKDPGAYVAQNIYQLPSDVDLSRFRQAWEKVVEAEVILRTRVVFTESCGFLQVVVREPISWHHLSDLQEITQQDRHLPPHNGGQLSRYSIVKEVGSQPHFIWTAHHALYDGWCIPLMLERVEACYRDISSVDRIIGAAYPRFIKYMSEMNTNDSDNFWTMKLSGTTAVQFPSLPHPAYQIHATSISTSTINIRRRATSHITLPSTIRAAWALVLAIYSGCSEDVIFGETLTGRDAPVSDITSILGPTLATVPTRIRIHPQTTVARFLEEVQEQSAEATPFQHPGLQRIKQLSSDSAKACGFQNLLAIHHDSDEFNSTFWDLRSSGTKGTNFYSYPMTVSCQLQDGKVDVEIHYDHEVISTWLVERIMIQLDFILQGLNSPEMMNKKLGEMKLLNVEDESAIQEWNSSPVQVVDNCIHYIIQQMALEQPESAAVESWDATFTYSELISLSSKLAVLIRKKNVRGPFIPLCFEKSAWTIVAMLAVLMSGCTIVPLDPSASTLR